MNAKQPYDKILFGLKVKRLRTGLKLNFAELALQTGMSVSYLNEIEKGKKSPKPDKVELLARAFHVPISDLTDNLLDRQLEPVEELLKSNFLNELPLDLFGIELNKVVEIIASAPVKVGAFVRTLLEISRNYALQEDNFYFNALRSYLELHENYFEEIEQKVDKFAAQFQVPRFSQVQVKMLVDILEKEYHYQIVEGGLKAYPELNNFRSIFVASSRKLLLNESLEDVQKAFQFGKELGFQFLQLEERANTSSLTRVRSFEEVLSHFRAGYFAAALLIPRRAFTEDMEKFFQKTFWEGESLVQLLHKYRCTPEMLFQRMTNLIPYHFGLKKIFFMRVIHTPSTNHIKIDKELHITRQHHPNGNAAHEHFCRRWNAIQILEELHGMQTKGKFTNTIAKAQISTYLHTKDEYLCISLAQPAHPNIDKNVSVTIGILMDDELKRKINFWNDSHISRKVVHTTCERCDIADCAERLVSPTVLQERDRRKKNQKALIKLMENEG